MTIFCTIYYICAYIQAIPQIVKLIKTKSSNDYSLWNIFLWLLATICWTIYVFTSNQKTIVNVGTIIDLILTIIVSILVLSFYKFKKKEELKK